MHNNQKVLGFPFIAFIETIYNKMTLFTPSEAKKEEKLKHPVGIKKKEDLDQLYGKNSSLIQKLETAAQLNFNRNCDTFKPELWMAVPLNVTATVN